MKMKEEANYLAHLYRDEPNTRPAYLDQRGYIHPGVRKIMTPAEKRPDSVFTYILATLLTILIVGWLAIIITFTVFIPSIGLLIAFLIPFACIVTAIAAPFCKLSRHLEGYHSMGRDW